MALPGSAEIEIEVSSGDWPQAGVRLFNAAGEEVTIGVTRHPLEVFVDRQRSRATAFHKDYPGRHSGAIRLRDGKVKMRVLFDRSVLEVFANDGETSITDRVYPTQPLDRLEPLSAGAASTSARFWPLRSTWGGR
jgi:sucrose-6-phosphate hydrolase SacC (GH32 family)